MTPAEFLFLWVRVLLLLLGPFTLLPAWHLLMRTEKPSVPLYAAAAWGVFVIFIVSNLSAAYLYCFFSQGADAAKCRGDLEGWALNPGLLVGFATSVFLGWVWVSYTLRWVRARAIYLSLTLTVWYVAVLAAVHWMSSR